MKRVCAWCQKDLDGACAAEAENRPITHGICLKCAQEALSDLAEPLRVFVDRLGVPVLVIESDPKVYTANTLACQILGKDYDDLQGKRPGEFLECVEARKPGGCGRQEHCKSCTIRRMVLETYATGKSIERVRAFPDVQVGEKVKTVCVEISTEKVGNVVLLRIDDLKDAPQHQATPVSETP